MKYIIFFYLWFDICISAMNTSSRPRSDKSRSVSSVIGSTKGSLESSRVRVLRNDEIRFGGSGSTANMFISGGLKEAPSTYSVFSKVSIAWAGGPSLHHVPIFRPTKDLVLRLGWVLAV